MKIYNVARVLFAWVDNNWDCTAACNVLILLVTSGVMLLGIKKP